MNALYAITSRDVDLKWTTWVDYLAPPHYSDFLIAVDLLTMATTYMRQFTDDWMFLVDDFATTTGFTRETDDPIVMTDAFSPEAGYFRQADDGVTLTDDTTMIIGQTASVNYADVVAMTDAFGSGLVMARALADSVVGSDAMSTTRILALPLADAAALTDGQNLDPYWPYVEALFHGDGPPGGVNYNFHDSSPYNRTVGVAGQLPFQGSVGPYVAANSSSSDYTGRGGSAWFGAVGTDYLYSPKSNDFAFPGGTDFTIEFWVYLTQDALPDGSGDLTGAPLFTNNHSDNSGGWGVNIRTTGPAPAIYLECVGLNNATYGVAQAPIVVSLHKWHHVAFTRQGVNTLQFYDGVLQGTTVLPDQNLWCEGDLWIGRGNVNRYFKGYIADVRIVKGAAMYTANFTPPTSILDGNTPGCVLKLDFANAAIFDSARKSNVHLDGATIGGGDLWGSSAIYFDGVSHPSNVQTPFALGGRFAPMAEDFTFETMVWLAGDSPPDVDGWRVGTLMGALPNGGSWYGWHMSLSGDTNTTGNFLYAQLLNGPLADAIYGDRPVSKSIWHHTALSRVGNMAYLHLDGVLTGSAPVTVGTVPPAVLPYMNPLMLGMSPYPSYYRPLVGYLNDARVTIGKARYGAANFTPPNAPHPNGPATYSERYPMQLSDPATMSDAPVLTKPGLTFQWLLAAGGGGGGYGGGNSDFGRYNGGGGGGGGGIFSGSMTVPNGGRIDVTIGDGGLASNTSGVEATNGGSSAFTGGPTAIGGGRGSSSGAGANGGSGGGSLGSNSGSAAAGTGTPGQGNDGGVGDFTHGGGGGGFGGAGAAGSAGGKGGAGWDANFIGQMQNYCAGGGGGQANMSTGGPAGGASAGAGGSYPPPAGVGGSAAPNRGGGGGGGGNDQGDSGYNGGAGGAGVAHFSFDTGSNFPTYHGAVSVSTNGGKTVLTFTGSGDFTPSGAPWSAFRQVGTSGGPHVTGGKLNYPLGVAPGDFAVLHISLVNIAGPNLGLPGWTLVARLQTTNPGSGNYGSEIWSKQLTAGDIAAPLNDIAGTGVGGAWTMVTYTGITSAVCLSPQGTSTPRNTIAALGLPGTKTGAGKLWAVAAIDANGKNNNLVNNTQGFVQTAKGICNSQFNDWSEWYLDSSTWDGVTDISIGNFITGAQHMAVLLELR